MLAALQLRSGHKLSRKTYLWQFSRDELCYFPLRQFYPCCGIENYKYFSSRHRYIFLIYLHSVAAGGGKVIGTFCAVFGVLVIGLPIPIIGKSFNNFYAREKRREKLVLERAREEATSRAVTAQVNRAAN